MNWAFIGLKQGFLLDCFCLYKVYITYIYNRKGFMNSKFFTLFFIFFFKPFGFCQQLLQRELELHQILEHAEARL